jgi:hypothetical protein
MYIVETFYSTRSVKLAEIQPGLVSDVEVTCRYCQENSSHLCKLLGVSRNPDRPWYNTALLPDDVTIIALSTQVQRRELGKGKTALCDFHVAVGQEPGDPEVSSCPIACSSVDQGNFTNRDHHYGYLKFWLIVPTL